MKQKVKEITLERARELIADKDMSEERLKKILESVKVFCNVAYGLYQKKDDPADDEPDKKNL